MPKYEMIIHVESAQDMAVIVQACQGTAELISSNKLEAQKKRGKRGVRIVNNPERKSRIVGLTGAELLRQTFNDGRNHKTRDLQTIFSQNGFAPKSASPALSILAKAGEVKQITEGEYVRTAKLREVNSGEGGHR
jgi:hypothetical protein